MLTFRNDEKFVVDFGLIDIVRDWADMEGDEPVRVDAVRKHVEDEWGVSWNQRAEIIERFRQEKRKNSESIEGCAGVDGRNGIRWFVFGEIPKHLRSG